MKTQRFKAYGMRFIASDLGLQNANEVRVNAPHYIDAVIQALRVYNVIRFEYPAYVYFAKSCNGDGLYKIGYSTDPITRTRGQVSEILQLWGFHDSQGALAFEKHLLGVYADCRQYWDDTDSLSEWVQLSPKEVDEIIKTPIPIMRSGYEGRNLPSHRAK